MDNTIDVSTGSAAFLQTVLLEEPTQSRRKTRWSLTYIIIIIVLCQSCSFHFYKTNTEHVLNTALQDSLKIADKYLIVHLNDRLYTLKNIQVNTNLLEGDIDSVQSEHAHYLNPRAGTSPPYKKKYESEVLSEIHLYAQGDIKAENHVLLPVNSFTRIDVYEKDIKKIKAENTQGTIITVLGVIFVPPFIMLMKVIRNLE